MKINIKTPFIGQAPMDGVSDAAFRYITDMVGHPDILFTEFVPVEGLKFGKAEILRPLIHHPTATPTVAQIYGVDIEAFYEASIIALELGFDGIDINMGCPDKSVSGRGAGAGLIRTPARALSIIRTVKKAVDAWMNGESLQTIHLRTRLLDASIMLQKQMNIPVDRTFRPTVSVKTRLGCDCPTISEWMPALASEKPDWITLHGRTLAQMYTGKADWNEIARASQILRTYGVKLIGNGDVGSRTDALEKIRMYGVDGILIGRASFGNPWVFTDSIPSIAQRLETALTHCEAYVRLVPGGYIPSLRKHLAWYCRGFDQSNALRNRLMQAVSIDEIKAEITPFLLKYRDVQ